MLGGGDRGCIEGRDLEGAERAVPDQRVGLGDPGIDGVDRFRADIEHHCIGGDGVDINRLVVRAGLEFARDDAVDRQDDGAAGCRCFGFNFPGGSARSCSHSDLPTSMPRAARKVLAMPPPITSASTFLTRFLSRSILVEPWRRRQWRQPGGPGCRGLFKRHQFRLHGASGIGRQVVRQALGRGMGAVGGGKGVVDEDVAIFGKRLGKIGIVLGFLAGMEPGVFEQEHIAIASPWRPRCRHAVGEAPLVVVPGQDRAQVPSMTLVWSMWKTEECGSWLKSRKQLVVGVAENALERAVGGCADRLVDFVAEVRAWQ
jgi:hypothetical protein